MSNQDTPRPVFASENVDETILLVANPNLTQEEQAAQRLAWEEIERRISSKISKEDYALLDKDPKTLTGEEQRKRLVAFTAIDQVMMNVVTFHPPYRKPLTRMDKFDRWLTKKLYDFGLIKRYM